MQTDMLERIKSSSLRLRIGLNAKITALLVGAVVFVTLSLGIYFDGVIRNQFNLRLLFFERGPFRLGLR